MPQNSCLAAVHWPHGSCWPLPFILHHCISNFIDICLSLFFLVTKTNLAVHEDKNRVPYVKVGKKNYLVKLNQKVEMVTSISFILFKKNREKKEEGKIRGLIY